MLVVVIVGNNFPKPWIHAHTCITLNFMIAETARSKV